MDGLIVRIKDSYPHDSDFRRAEGIIRSIHVRKQLKNKKYIVQI